MFEGLLRGSLDHRRCIEVYDEAIALFAKWDQRSLLKYAVVCKSVLLDEYAREPDRAVGVLSSDLPSALAKDAHVLHQHAKILYGLDRHAEASAIWREATTEFSKFDPLERAFAYRLAAISASKTGEWAVAARYYSLASEAAGEAKDAEVLRLGLIADQALSQFQSDDVPGALRALYETIRALPTVALDGRLRNHHVHAMIAHVVAWIDGRLIERNDPRRSAVDEQKSFIPGMCSNLEPHQDILKHEVQPVSMMHLLLASAAIRLGEVPEIAEDYFNEYGDNAAPTIWLHYCHARVDRAIDTGDVRSMAESVAAYAAALPWFKESEQQLDAAPIPQVSGSSVVYPGVTTAVIVHSFAFLTRALSREENVNQAARLLFQAYNAALPAMPLELKFALAPEEPLTRPPPEPLMYEWGRSLRDAVSQLETPAGLTLFLFRAVNYLAASTLHYRDRAVIAELAVSRWHQILEHQRFALASPNLHEGSIREALTSDEMDPLKKVASIVLATASAARVPLAVEAIEFLKGVAAGKT